MTIADRRARHGGDAGLHVLDQMADYGARLRIWQEDVQVPADQVSN